MSKDNGGPAFPVNEVLCHNGDIVTYAEPGMTMRDYFATHAPFTMSDAIAAIEHTGSARFTGAEVMEMLADMRGAYADAMLAERAK